VPTVNVFLKIIIFNPLLLAEEKHRGKTAAALGSVNNSDQKHMMGNT